MKKKTHHRGSIYLLEFIIASVILISAFLFFFSGSFSQNRVLAESQDSYVAHAYASELLEMFRGWKGAWLWKYLQNNPTDPTLPPYQLCTRINIIDRNVGKIINGDPIAKLPAINSLSSLADAKYQANRFYQIHVVNKTSLRPVTSYCSKTARNSTLDTDNELLLVTVGVSWIPKGQKILDPKRIALSTLVQEWPICNWDCVFACAQYPTFPVCLRCPFLLDKCKKCVAAGGGEECRNVD